MTTTHPDAGPAPQDPTERQGRHALVAAVVEHRGRAISPRVVIRLLDSAMSEARFHELTTALFEGRDLIIDDMDRLIDPAARRAVAAAAPAEKPPATTTRPALSADPDEIPEPDDEGSRPDQPATPTRTERTAVDSDPDEIPDEPDDA